jgi:hypothetical protein
MKQREPRLEELLDDPLVKLLMERDAVDREKVLDMFSSLRAGRHLPAGGETDRATA